MRHLIVEACIARNILDTSAYLWPDYVKGRSNQIPRSASGQMPGWSSLMKGSPLTPPMVNALVSTPASRYADSSLLYGSFSPLLSHALMVVVVAIQMKIQATKAIDLTSSLHFLLIFSS